MAGVQEHPSCGEGNMTHFWRIGWAPYAGIYEDPILRDADGVWVHVYRHVWWLRTKNP